MSGVMLPDLASGEISEISFYKTPDGNVLSENNIFTNEMRLPGFIWREDERPDKVSDLFSESDKELEIVEIE